MISVTAPFRTSLPLATTAPTSVERLRDLYARSHLARALLDAAAERTQRAWRETALSKAFITLHEKLGQRPPRKAVIELFKALQGLGVVRHTVGRSGHQTRIEWLYRSPSVAAVAAGRAAEFEKWGQPQRSRLRRKERLAKRKKKQLSGDAVATAPAAGASPAKKAAAKSRGHCKDKQPQVVLDLGCGVAVTWNRPRNPTPAEAEQFAKAVAATVQSLAGAGA